MSDNGSDRERPHVTDAIAIMPGRARGPVLASLEPLSFWGGVDPASGRVIDARHPLHGACISGCVLMLPSSRGSCSGSGVLLDLVLGGRGPAAIVFSEPEDVLTLGALIASEMFDRSLPVLRLSRDSFATLAASPQLAIEDDRILAGDIVLPVTPPLTSRLELTEAERRMRDGARGEAAALCMRVILAMAAQQGATSLIPVTRAHIDGCIYASPANLTFAERMVELGALVTVPTTMNAISVDRENWRTQGMEPEFGNPAQRLADAYVEMGCAPTFTCAPYLLPDAPEEDEAVGWSESNAVVFANSVLGARTAKHPDFLDLCIAVTGRAPFSGVYLEEARRPSVILDFDLPGNPGDGFWPLAGYLAGRYAPDDIPLLRGLSDAGPDPDDLKALCAAFGTMSAAPMLHVEGVTPEADLAPLSDAGTIRIGGDRLRETWRQLNAGPDAVDLVAIGSPHASLSELARLREALAGRKATIPVIATAGRRIIAEAISEGIIEDLRNAGVTVHPDICWCSIREPVFPPKAAVVMTNSGKYAHYGPGLSGRSVRLAGLDDCIRAAIEGVAPPRIPRWLA
jgi:cis-L-3-hydroxyproline dehydratase